MGLKYRTDEEVADWQARDPITLFESRLAEQNILSAADAKEIHEVITAEVQAAVEFAESSPLPTPEALLEDVYA
jgi:pyruvate dehydrogenase E1 component alpha subunit